MPVLFFRRKRYHNRAAAPQTPVSWNISNQLGLPCVVLGYLCCKKVMTAWLWLASLLADAEVSLLYPGRSPAASTVVRVCKSRKMAHKSRSELVILRVPRRFRQHRWLPGPECHGLLPGIGFVEGSSEVVLSSPALRRPMERSAARQTLWGAQNETRARGRASKQGGGKGSFLKRNSDSGMRAWLLK